MALRDRRAALGAGRDGPGDDSDSHALMGLALTSPATCIMLPVGEVRGPGIVDGRASGSTFFIGPAEGDEAGAVAADCELVVMCIIASEKTCDRRWPDADETEVDAPRGVELIDASPSSSSTCENARSLSTWSWRCPRTSEESDSWPRDRIGLLAREVARSGEVVVAVVTRSDGRSGGRPGELMRSGGTGCGGCHDVVVDTSSNSCPFALGLLC